MSQWMYPLACTVFSLFVAALNFGWVEPKRFWGFMWILAAFLWGISTVMEYKENHGYGNNR